jgi:hypothetical protein
MLELANALRRRASSVAIVMAGNAGSGLLLCLLLLIAFSPSVAFQSCDVALLCGYARELFKAGIIGCVQGDARQRQHGTLLLC